ncbi:52 kDa repressor of the inhibitor of the protein kinase-like [Ostrinia furnacalis]|uniref:52 kDa repressor of the inhibitor of the protein kinase-like n=1 Tax=Ostrinia furnacalis TaxID=93504 RepID=UPI00103E33F9|nr:52 kDa repressor of the inhibitor of the protein kinase-like [Ostrinia furnacalis]
MPSDNPTMASNKPTNPFKRYCCVNGCVAKRKNKDYSMSFFKIPDDPERRREWLAAIDREDLLDEKKSKRKFRNYFVCSEHFEESAIVTTICKRITQDAVPVKSLPYKNRTDTQPEACGSKRARLKTSKNLSSTVIKTVNNMSVASYSHAQTQTETRAEEHIVLYETDEDESDKPNIDENETKRNIAEPNIGEKVIKCEIAEPSINLKQSDIDEPNTDEEYDADIKIEICEPDIEDLLNELKKQTSNVI